MKALHWFEFIAATVCVLWDRDVSESSALKLCNTDPFSNVFYSVLNNERNGRHHRQYVLVMD